MSRFAHTYEDPDYADRALEWEAAFPQQAQEDWLADLPRLNRLDFSSKRPGVTDVTDSLHTENLEVYSPYSTVNS